VRDRAKPARPWAWGIAAGAAALVAAAGVWFAIARKPASAPPPVAEPAPAAAATPARAQPDELVFWESVRSSTNRAELEAYLAKYPDGTFAPLARARIDALAAAEPKSSAPAAAPAAPERRPAVEAPRANIRKPEQPSQEALFWDSVRNSGNPAELRAYLAKYPDGTFAPLARARLDALAAAAPQTSVPPQVAAVAPKASPPSAERAGAANRFDGVWAARVSCDAWEEATALTLNLRTEIRNGELTVEWGRRDPGYDTLSGRVTDDGRLTLAGHGVSRMSKYYGKPYSSQFQGGFSDGRFELRGALGRRPCALTLAPSSERTASMAQPSSATPSPAAAKPAAQVAAVASGRYDGVWRARYSCDAWQDAPAVAREVRAEIRGSEATMQWGKQGEPGYNTLSGRITDDDRLELAGHGISSLARVRGRQYQSRFQGRFSDGRYEANGAFGSRPCTMTFQR
jgi:hypothetical protein